MKKLKRVKSSFLLLACLLAMLVSGLPAFAGQTSMTLSKKFDIVRNYAQIEFRLQDRVGSDSYWTSYPEIYIDGKYICNFSNLNIPIGDSDGNYKNKYNYRGSVNKDPYTVFAFEVNAGNNYDYVQIGIYCDYWEVDGSQHTVTIKGKWANDGNSKNPTAKELSIKLQADNPNEFIIDNCVTQRSNGVVSYTMKNMPKNYSNYQYILGLFKNNVGYNNRDDIKTNRGNGNVTYALSNLGGNGDGTVSFNYSNRQAVTFYPVLIDERPEGNLNFGYSQVKPGFNRPLTWFKKFGTVTVNGFPFAKNVNASTDDAYTKKVRVTWEEGLEDRNANRNGKWYIFRKVGGTANYEKKAEVDYGTRFWIDDDANKKYYDLSNGDQTSYDYAVVFVPYGWTVNKPDDAKDLYGTVNYKMTRTFGFTNFRSQSTVKDITISWTTPALTDASQSHYYELVVQKSENNQDFSDVRTFNITNAETITGSYTDKDNLVLYRNYYYRLSIRAQEKQYYSDVLTASLDGSTKVTTFNASRGIYSGSVKLQWEVDQIGEGTTYFQIERRQLGNTDEKAWANLYSTSGSEALYSYDDNTVAPGIFYEYRISCWGLDDNKQKRGISQKTTDGFCVSTGTITGRISYGTGTAVDSVKVSLVQSSDDDQAKAQFYSVRVNNLSGGVYLPLDTTQAKELYAQNQPFTIQSWVNLDAYGENGQTIQPMWFDIYNQLSIWGRSYTDGSFRPRINCRNDQDQLYSEEANIWLWPHNFYNVSVTYDGNRNWVLRVIDANGSVWTHAWQAKGIEKLQPGNPSLVFGTNLGNNWRQAFRGYIDEVRIWTKALSEKEILATYDHQLSGDEKDLYCYWNFDEGINNQTVAYDYSKTGGVPNNRAGEILSGSTTSTVVPPSDAFGIFGRTDADGNYVIKGVPFTGQGTNYSVVPTMGVHTFNPARLSRFVSQNSLNHSGVDFKDESSFEVSGSAYYENTNYPVQGANLYVDGTMCSRDGEPIVTDEQGNFTISVPIGDHFIQIKKQGHEFADNGRYPADANGVGVRYTFDQPIKNLTFTDITKVVVTGRVVGGEIESEKPLGMGQSRANIGQAVVKLTAGTYKMNVTRKIEGTAVRYDNAQQRLNYAAATNRVASTAYVDGGNEDAVKTIVITTDPKTGEFATLLPPVAYTVKSVEIPSNKDIIFDMSKIAAIDATNPIAVSTDSVTTGEDAGQTFTYNSSLIVTQRVEPTFDVRQKNAPGFGDENYRYLSIDGSAPQNVPLYTVDNSGNVKYTMGYPVFMSENNYTFTFEAYEQYTNKDDARNILIDKVPLKDAIVTVVNRFAAGQTVSFEGKMDDSRLASNQLQLDSLGKAEYKFKAGLPNITEPYTLGMSISYEAGDVTKQWSGNDTFKAIVLGELPSGSNFVTSGPDKVLMILRDPPGSNSSAWYQHATSVSESNSYEGSFITQNEARSLSKFGVSQKTITGTGINGFVVETEAKFNLTVGLDANVEVNSGFENITTTVNTDRISTDDSEDHVGAAGDVFVGTATNILFGNARSVDVRKKADGTFYIGRDDVLSTGMKFGTSFNYTQNYVENILLPNFYTLRDSLLHAPDASITTNNTNDVIYISNVAKDDSRFGSDNFDEKVWGTSAASRDALEGPSYRVILPNNYQNMTDPATGLPKVFEDKVRWYNQQIKHWTDILANNERAKIEAIRNRAYLDKNVSFSSGVTVESSVDSTSYHQSANTETFEALAVIGGEKGTEINKTGVSFSFQTTTGQRHSWVQGDETEETKSIGYVLKESGADDAISVDIYDAPDGFGPIFVTRGGQTSCPYEDKYVSKYYQPGTEISAATMQIEKPELDVENAVATDIPSGGKANYTLIMRNTSETMKDVWFQLAMIDKSNADGAMLTIDGQPLTDGRVFLVEAGKELRKQLQLTQTDQSVLDYKDIQLVLRSQCQEDIADTVAVSAHFVATCSDIVLDIPQRTVNSQTGASLKMTVKGYDRNFRSFRGFRIQYKGLRDVEWKNAQTYVNADSLKKGDNAKAIVIDGATTSFTFDMSNAALYPDQTYLFRAQTICMLSNTETSNESDEIQVIKDMALPKLMGNASPANGILTSDGEIAVNFNENIKASSLNKNDNFIVTAKLNGYTVDHDVALQLNGTEAARTNTTIDLSDRPFAVNMWVKYTDAGTLLSHGSEGSGLTLGVDDTGKLVVKMGNTEMKSTKDLPKNTWVFLQVSYDYSKGNSKLTADAAYDAYDVKLLDNAAPDYTGNGSITLGGTMKGAVQEVSLWDANRSWAEAQMYRNAAKRANTRNLIGYWKLDEGEGALATDVARARNMRLSAANWYYATPNRALALNGTNSHADIKIGACSPQSDEDYTLEMWFRGNKPAAGQKATLFSVNGDRLAATISDKGAMSLVVDSTERALGTTDVLDTLWHHFALNVLADGTATVYIDGNNKLQFTPQTPVRMQADNIVVGAMRRAQTFGAADFVYSDFLKGNVDEIRLWNARLTADVIRSRRNARLEGTEPGLVAYYPFETVKVDQFNQAVVTEDEDDHAASAADLKNTAALTDAKVGTEAPGLKGISRLQNVAFDFTASERRIVINLNETDEALEGTTVNITLRDVRDENDNLAQPITWTAYVSRNQLKWGQSDLKLAQENGENTTAEVAISNQSGTTEAWTITGMPSWLTVDTESGSLVPMGSRTLRFSVPASVAIGHYDATIYVTGNRGIAEPLAVQLHVTGKKPEWTVNPSDYENSSVLIGQIQYNGTPGEDSEDIVAAFDKDGNCIGVAHPEYNQRYNRFFTFLTMYGNAAMNGQTVKFRVWDASTGKVHSFVDVTPNTVTVKDNAIYGTIANPVILNATDMIEQTMNLGNKWQWLSLNVRPDKLGVSDVFAPIAVSTATVKVQDKFSTYAKNEWNGTLSNLDVTKMFMVYMNEADTLRVTGQQLAPADETVSLSNGWSWMGYTPDFTASPVYALAPAAPQNGDVVKDQFNFAVYQDYEWIGSLKSMKPGMGYMYNTSKARTFNYPSNPQAMSGAKKAPSESDEPQESVFPEWDFHKYPNNMTVIAQIKQDGSLVHNAEVCVLDGDEVRGKIHEIKDWYFITVSGEGLGPDLTIKVAMPNGEIVTAKQTMQYRDNQMLGTIDNPYVIDLSTTTGITEIGYGDVSIAPRRVSQNVTVTSGSVIKEVMVFNMQGHLVKAEQPDSNRCTVDMNSVPEGIYVVDAMTADGKHTKARIVKVK